MKSSMVCMTDGNGQGVGSVLRRDGVKFEQGAHHVLHLPFFGLTVPSHRLLDLAGGVIEDSQIVVQGSNHGRAPGMAKLEG